MCCSLAEVNIAAVVIAAAVVVADVVIVALMVVVVIGSDVVVNRRGLVKIAVGGDGRGERLDAVHAHRGDHHDGRLRRGRDRLALLLGLFLHLKQLRGINRSTNRRLLRVFRGAEKST